MATYFIRQGGSDVQGPFDERLLRKWIAQGRVKPTMELSRNGDDYLPLEYFYELFSDPTVKEDRGAAPSAWSGGVVNSSATATNPVAIAFLLIVFGAGACLALIRCTEMGARVVSDTVDKELDRAIEENKREMQKEWEKLRKAGDVVGTCK